MKYTLRTMKVLRKGDLMTKSEIEYLLRREVSRTDIAKALGMKTKEFSEWWLNRTGKLERNVGDYGFITPEEYLELKEKGMLDKEIATLKGVRPNIIHVWKMKFKDEIGDDTIGKRQFMRLNITKEQYIEYRKQRLSETEIAEKLNTTRFTLRKWRNEMFTEKELEGLPKRARNRREAHV